MSVGPEQNSLTRKPLTQPCQEALAELHNVFSTQFDLWDYNGQWECTCSGSGNEDTLSALNTRGDLSDLLDQTDSPVVHSLESEQNLILIPVPQMDSGLVSTKNAVAVGMVSHQDTGLIQRLAQTAFQLLHEKQKNHDNQAQMKQYAQQVSYDFEELYWLRELAQQLEYCGADIPVEEITEKVLPSLRDLIKAKSLIYFPVSSREHSSRIDESTRLIYGEQDVDLRECQEIINRFEDKAHIQPVVHNHQFNNSIYNESGLENSFILVPVAKSGFISAWLLALGKENEPLENISNTETCFPGSSELEFGSFEAGLMATSGILLASHAHNVHLFSEQQSFTVNVIRSMISAIDVKDPYTCGHSDRVALMAKRLAEQYGMSHEECEQIYMTGLLHDIGKIFVPDEILCKNGRLTDEEFEIIKKHPEMGFAILKHLKQLKYVLPGVLHHHERYDGKGYPHQLAGEEIPIEGRILAVVDAYDAMTSCRPYRSAMSFEKAESILLEHAGTQWDAKLVECFFEALNDIHAICSRTEKDSKELIRRGITQLSGNSLDDADLIDLAVSLARPR